MLGGHDGVDDDTEPALRGPDDVAVAVRQQGEAPAAGAQRAELGGDLGERRPVRDRRPEDRSRRRRAGPGRGRRRPGAATRPSRRGSASSASPPRRRARGRCSARAARRRVRGTAGRPTSASPWRQSISVPKQSNVAQSVAPIAAPPSTVGRHHGSPDTAAGERRLARWAHGDHHRDDARPSCARRCAPGSPSTGTARCRARSGWRSSSTPATPCRRGRPSGSGAASTVTPPRSIIEEFRRVGAPGAAQDKHNLWANTVLAVRHRGARSSGSSGGSSRRREDVPAVLRARAPAPTSPACRPAPSATATSGSSTARRCGRRAARRPSSACSSPARTGTSRSTVASRSSGARCASPASTCAR